jgi:Cytochrome P450
MTDTQLLDELKTLFLAGHETTAIGLSWTFYLVAQHPEIDAQLAEELEAVLGNRAPAFGDCATPGWGMSRQANRPFQVAGYDLAALRRGPLSSWCLGSHIAIRDSFPSPNASILPGGGTTRSAAERYRGLPIFHSEEARACASGLRLRRWKQRCYWRVSPSDSDSRRASRLKFEPPPR